MPSICEVGLAIKRKALDFWREFYPEAHEFTKTAGTQYGTDSGCVFIWRMFPDWETELVLHEAIEALKTTDYELLVVSSDNCDDYFIDGEYRYFNLRVKTSIDYDGSDWWRN